jgi:hypothetical protein
LAAAICGTSNSALAANKKRFTALLPRKSSARSRRIGFEKEAHALAAIASARVIARADAFDQINSSLRRAAFGQYRGRRPARGAFAAIEFRP